MDLDRKTLSDALSLASKAVFNRPTAPILAYLKLSPGEDTLSIEGTDLETSIRLDIPTTENGFASPIAVQPKALLAALKALPKSTKRVTLEPDAARPSESDSPGWRLRMGPLSFTGLAPEDFPTISSPAGSLLTIPGLRVGIEAVSYAISHDESRYSLNGVLVDTEAIVATDGHRLAYYRIAPHTAPRMIVPRKTIELLAKAWSRKEPASGAWIGDQLVPSFTGKGKVKGNGEITGDGDVTGVAFPIANGWITSRVIEGTFPDYRQVIPTTPTTRCTVPLDSFREILAQACAVAEPRTKGLQLTLCQENFQIHAKDFDQGETTLPVPGATVEGPDLVIGINGRYLMEMLAPLDRVVVTLNFTAPTAPMWLTDETYTAVVMPMRI